MTVAIYTTAGRDYDYSTTKQVLPDAGTFSASASKRQTVRLVEVPDEAEALTQIGRYHSGAYYAVTAKAFWEDVREGWVDLTDLPAPTQLKTERG